MDGSDATLATMVDGSDAPGQSAAASYVAPDADSDIKDSTTFTWVVSHWSQLENFVTSSLFECGGHTWRVLLYPTGMDGKLPKHVSVYLDAGVGHNKPAGWHECAKFQFTLSNSVDSKFSITSREVQHRFTAEEPDWGFTRLMPLQELLAVQQGHQRPVIEGDSVTIIARVKVFHDPTGILWHNFSMYNSRKHTGYIGLINQGSTGYMNAALQVLFHIRAFRKAVYDIPTNNHQATKSVALALQRIFYRMETSEEAVSTTELTSSFGWKAVDSYMQHDFLEFIRVLQDKTATLMRNTKSDGTHDKLFTGKMKSYIKAVDVDYLSSRIENFQDLQLQIKGLQNIAASFRDCTAVAAIDDYPAGIFGSQKAEMGITFQSFPPVLLLQLKRFDYDIQRDAMVKLSDRFEYPANIDLGEFLGPGADKSTPWIYHLHAVIVHHGSLAEGHYEALIKPDKGSLWFKFDDDRVTPVLEKEVFEDGYGGSSRPGQKSDTSSNAYILVYVRESELDEIFAPIPQGAIPRHLKLAIEEDRRLKEQKRKEKEQKLYMTIEVVTEDLFLQHEGFDLANFPGSILPPSKIANFVVPKTETYASFKDRVAKHFNYGRNQVHFWVIASRHNKTLRPMYRLSDGETRSLESIRYMQAWLSNNLRLYLELTSGSQKLERPPGHIFVFLKHFDASKQTLLGSGAVWIPRASKPADLCRIINARMHWAASTAVHLYEEIKPGMIEPLNVKATLDQMEIDDGDIICFRSVLQDREIHDLVRKGHCTNLIMFYQILQNRFLCSFSSSMHNSQFDLLLSKTDTFDIMAVKVGRYLNVPPSRLRFTTTDKSNHRPETIIERGTGKTLGKILSFSDSLKPMIKYEILGSSTADALSEVRRGFSWMGHDNRKKSIHLLTLRKAATLEDARERLRKQVQISPGGTGTMRFFLMSPDKKAQKPLAIMDKVSDIPESTEIFVEEMTREELNLRNGERLVDIFHFNKTLSRTHDVPFKFVLKPGETVSETRRRLRARLGLSEEKFSAYRLAIQVSNFRQPLYLDEDEILYDSRFIPQALALDHAEIL